MLLNDFISKYNGRGIDFDGVYGDQCMDLMHQFCVEVLGINDGSVLAAPSAKDVYLNFPNVNGSVYFEKIDNTPDNVPLEGDILFWGTKIGPYGHVAVFLNGNTSKFSSFDQNWPVGAKCAIVDHTYNGLLGWLRFKKSNSIDSDYVKTLEADRTRFWQERDEARKELQETIIQLDAEKAKSEQLSGFVDQIAKMLNVPVKQDEIAKAIGECVSYQDIASRWETKYQEEEKLAKDYQEKYQTTQTQLLDATGALQTAKEDLKKIQTEYESVLNGMDRPLASFTVLGLILNIYRKG